MIAGSGPLSQADVDAIEDRLADVDEHPGADDPKLIHHDERLAT